MPESKVAQCPRPAHCPLTEEELNEIKEQLLESIYTDIGRSIVKKVLWVVGSIGMAMVAWLMGNHNIKL